MNVCYFFFSVLMIASMQVLLEKSRLELDLNLAQYDAPISQARYLLV